MSAGNGHLSTDQAELEQLLRPSAQWPQNVKYTPLSSDTQTRVLHVCYNADSRRLSASLEVVDLAEYPQYDALSYYWGLPAAKRKAILVGGEEVMIGKSLHAFLRRFAAEQIRTIWVDALCINQSNVQERNQQFTLMDIIYRRAGTVHIWLGKGDSDTDYALTCCRHWQDMQRSGGVHRSRLIQNVSVSLLSIATRPYWKRVWIIQEIALARHRLLVCGDLVLPFEHFCTFAKAVAGIIRKDKYLKGPRSDSATDFVYPSLHLLSQVLERVELLWERPRSLLQIAGDFASHLCTDTKDKIFGMRSLATNGQQIAVDYKRSFVDILLDVLAHEWRHEIEERGGFPLSPRHSSYLYRIWSEHTSWAQNLIRGSGISPKNLLNPQLRLEKLGSEPIPFLFMDALEVMIVDGLPTEVHNETSDYPGYILFDQEIYDSGLMKIRTINESPEKCIRYLEKSHGGGKTTDVTEIFQLLVESREIQYCQLSDSPPGHCLLLHLSRRAMLAEICSSIDKVQTLANIQSDDADPKQVPDFCQCSRPSSAETFLDKEDTPAIATKHS